MISGSEHILKRLLRVLLSAALLAMLFPLQPELPCAKKNAAAATVANHAGGPEYILAAQSVPTSLICESEAQRRQLCDVLPAGTLSCLTDAKAVAPADRSKTPSLQQDGHFIHSSALPEVLSQSSYQKQALQDVLASIVLKAKDPARAPPFRRA